MISVHTLQCVAERDDNGEEAHEYYHEDLGGETKAEPDGEQRTQYHNGHSLGHHQIGEQAEVSGSAQIHGDGDEHCQCSGDQQTPDSLLQGDHGVHPEIGHIADNGPRNGGRGGEYIGGNAHEAHRSLPQANDQNKGQNRQYILLFLIHGNLTFNIKSNWQIGFDYTFSRFTLIYSLKK